MNTISDIWNISGFLFELNFTIKRGNQEQFATANIYFFFKKKNIYIYINFSRYQKVRVYTKRGFLAVEKKCKMEITTNLFVSNSLKFE